MPVAKVEAALEVEVMSWRMGACVTIAVEVGVWTGAVVGDGRAGRTGFPEENIFVKLFIFKYDKRCH